MIRKGLRHEEKMLFLIEVLHCAVFEAAKIQKKFERKRIKE
jgi:hypothetical protein